MTPKLWKTGKKRPLWQVVYSVDGLVKRRHFALDKEAEAQAYHAKLCKDAAKVGTKGLLMDARARAEYAAARELLEPHKISVLQAVVEYARMMGEKREDQLLTKLLADFIKDREARRLRPRSVDNLNKQLSAFLRSTSARTLSQVTRDIAEEWLNRPGISRTTAINNSLALSGMWHWLKRMGYASYIITDRWQKPIADVRKDPAVLTPEQCRVLMDAAQDVRGGAGAAAMALLAFAGLRPTEVVQLSWSDIHLDRREIRIRAGKKRGSMAVRNVPIAENLAAWLKRYKDQNLVMPRKLWETIRKRAGLFDAWEGDTLRHSWISYKLALEGDVSRVALQAGNSAKVIFAHYHTPQNEKDARAWFALLPEAEQVSNLVAFA